MPLMTMSPSVTQWGILTAPKVTPAGVSLAFTGLPISRGSPNQGSGAQGMGHLAGLHQGQAHCGIPDVLKCTRRRSRCP